jgi:hypothetical protein
MEKWKKGKKNGEWDFWRETHSVAKAARSSCPTLCKLEDHRGRNKRMERRDVHSKKKKEKKKSKQTKN